MNLETKTHGISWDSIDLIWAPGIAIKSGIDIVLRPPNDDFKIATQIYKSTSGFPSQRFDSEVVHVEEFVKQLFHCYF